MQFSALLGLYILRWIEIPYLELVTDLNLDFVNASPKINISLNRGYFK